MPSSPTSPKFLHQTRPKTRLGLKYLCQHYYCNRRKHDEFFVDLTRKSMSGLILVNFSIIYILEKSLEPSGSFVCSSFTEHIDVTTCNSKQLVEAFAKRVNSSCKYVLGTFYYRKSQFIMLPAICLKYFRNIYP